MALKGQIATHEFSRWSLNPDLRTTIRELGFQVDLKNCINRAEGENTTKKITIISVRDIRAIDLIKIKITQSVFKICA